MKMFDKSLVLVLALMFACLPAFAKDTEEKVSNIKNIFNFDSVKEGDDFSLLHYDAKKVDEDLKEDDIEVTADNIAVSKNGVTRLSGSGNIRTQDLLVNFEKGDFVSQKRLKGNDYLLHLQNDVRINSGNSNIIYAKSLFYGSNGDLYAQNARVINSDGGSLIARDVTNQKKDIFIFRDGFFTSCTISPDENEKIANYLRHAPAIVTNDSTWEENKKQSAINRELYEDPFLQNIISKEAIDYEIIPKNNSYKSIESDFEKINNKYMFSEWRMVTKDGTYNKKTKDAIFKNVTFRIFNLPVFYIPKLKLNMNASNEPKTGLLPMNMLISGGGNQIGFIIPWYWRISHNKDFLFTANVFQDISGVMGGSLKPGSTFDGKRYLANYYQFQYRHLIEKKNGMVSEYSIKGSVTESTQAINYDTKQAIFNSNGSYQYGYRGHVRTKGIFSITPTTTIKHRYLWISDPNYAALYMRKGLPYHTNITSIEDVTDTSFNRFAVVSWTPMLLNYQMETTPAVAILGNSFFRSRQDSIGGYSFINNNASYLNRSQGYSRGAISSEFGYNIDKIVYGTMLRFNNSFRGTGYDSYYTNGGALNPNSTIINPTLLTFGTYSQMLGNGLYNLYGGSGFGGTTLISSQLMANHPLYQAFRYGTLIIDPMISWQNNFGNNYGFFTNEDSFASRLTFDNLFEKNINNGLDGFTNGSRISFGLKANFIDLSGYKITYGGGLMNTITNFGNNYYLPIQSGIYNNGLSNYVGMFAVSTPTGRVTISNNHRIDISTGNLLEMYTTVSMVVIHKLLTFSIVHTYLNKDVLFLQKIQSFNFQMISVLMDVNFTDNFIFQFGIIKAIGNVSTSAYNLSTGAVTTNVLTDPLLSTVFSIVYKTGCVEYGFTGSQSFVGIPGMSSVWNFGGSITFSGI